MKKTFLIALLAAAAVSVSFGEITLKGTSVYTCQKQCEQDFNIKQICIRELSHFHTHHSYSNKEQYEACEKRVKAQIEDCKAECEQN